MDSDSPGLAVSRPCPVLTSWPGHLDRAGPGPRFLHTGAPANDLAIRVGTLPSIDIRLQTDQPLLVADSAVDPDLRSHGDWETGRVALAVAIPLAVVSLAYALWWLSDRLLYIGPLDRAAFGWAVVIPVWIGGPVSAAFAWRPLNQRQTRAAALGFGIVVTTVATVLFWQSVAFPDCPNPIRSAAEWVLPAVIVGLTIGGGLAVSGFMGTSIVRSGHPWLAVALTGAAELGLIFAAIFVFVGVSVGAGTEVCGLPR